MFIVDISKVHTMHSTGQMIDAGRTRLQMATRIRRKRLRR